MRPQRRKRLDRPWYVIAHHAQGPPTATLRAGGRKGAGQEPLICPGFASLELSTLERGGVIVGGMLAQGRGGRGGACGPRQTDSGGSLSFCLGCVERAESLTRDQPRQIRQFGVYVGRE